MKVKLIATKNAPYRGRIKAGDEFSVLAEHAKVLVALGHATYAPTKSIHDEAAALRAKGEYLRRDMVATAPAPTRTLSVRPARAQQRSPVDTGAPDRAPLTAGKPEKKD